jgi:hypothetical protein
MINVNGVTLRIGMSRAEYEEFYGRTIENGWIIAHKDAHINVLSINNVIVFLASALTQEKEWSLDNGIEFGTPIERVRELLGEEDYIVPDDPENQYPVHQLVYLFEDGSVLELRYFNNDAILTGINANTIVTFTLHSGERDIIANSAFGTIDDDHSGEGDALVRLTYTVPDAVYDITHENSIKVLFIEDITGTEYEIYTAEGAGAHIVKIQQKLEGEMVNGSLRIETKGAWRVIVKLP